MRHLLLLLLASCSFANAQELRPDHEPDVVEPLIEPAADDYAVRIARAQYDADCMLADVRAAHDDEAEPREPVAD